MPNHKTDALIVGGGLAGAALATLLARQGRAVSLLEKSEAAHNKVCGEFLSREAIFYLNQLGIDHLSLGAVPIYRVRLAARTLIAQCDLPFPAMSLTRRVLDESLLDLALKEGVHVVRGCRVDQLIPAPIGWTAIGSDGKAFAAPSAFLATGKHDVAGHQRPKGKQNDLVAFKMYFRLAPKQQEELAGHVELILFPGGYTGLQLVEQNIANLGLLVTQAQLRACGGTWSKVLQHILHSSEYLSQRLANAEPLLDKPLALSSIPYGLVRSHSADGLWRLGDQGAVIPSFSGDGMSIALHTAFLAAQTYLEGSSAEAFQRCVDKEMTQSIHFASILSRLMIVSPVLAQVARVWPSLLGHIASKTRIQSRALLTEATRTAQRDSDERRILRG
jgi:flavin-dependent dehydrogenase